MMREAEVPVTFLPADRTVFVLGGTRLVEAAAEAGIVIDSPCGGEGLCGKCRVRIRSGECLPTEAEERIFSADEIRQGWRLACQTSVQGPLSVFVPAESLTAANHQILTEIKGSGVFSAEKTPDPFISFAVAVDVGTTTLAAVLLDVHMGEERAVAARLNPQTRFGDDVLSRILFARENSNGLQILHESIIQAVNEMIAELCTRAKIRREEIGIAAISGNTTMQQLLLGIDTRSLGEMPFTPAMGPSVSLDADRLGLQIHPRGRVYVFPIIGGFVGGDTVSGILATDLVETPGPTLLVDIGTNGEIVLWAGGKLTAASTAAGPAFEGARISCGMRACDGAIEKIVIDGRLRINVIGGVSPIGVCGSGLIDAAAELLRHQVLSSSGKLRAPDELSPEVLPDLRRRIMLAGEKVSFLLASAEESGTGKPIALTQRDFRELQLASGAIRAGIGILLKGAGLEPHDLREIFLAGGFGNFIRRSNAQRIGLLPGRVAHHCIRYRGNTSLAGARLAVLSSAAREKAEKLARLTEHVELSADGDFHNAFAEAMLFPEE